MNVYYCGAACYGNYNLDTDEVLRNCRIEICYLIHLTKETTVTVCGKQITIAYIDLKIKNVEKL